MSMRRSALLPSALAFGFAFLYVPIFSMIAYSFNASRLVTVWDAAHSPTLKWYGALFANGQITDAALLSLKIAAMNATGAVILGTMAGFALIRFGRFRGRSLLAALTTAPLVLPEIISGLSLLLLFVAMQQLIGWQGARRDHDHDRPHQFLTDVRGRDRTVAAGRLRRVAGRGGARPWGPAGDGVCAHHAAFDRAGAALRLAVVVYAIVG